MPTGLDVLGLVSERPGVAGFGFMLARSLALAYYATPRMTRDLDIVVGLAEQDAEPLVAAPERDLYVDATGALAAVRSERFINLMHFRSEIKVDLIVRKAADVRLVEFDRR